MQIDKDIPIPTRGKQKDPQKVQIAKSLEIFMGMVVALVEDFQIIEVVMNLDYGGQNE